MCSTIILYAQKKFSLSSLQLCLLKFHPNDLFPTDRTALFVFQPPQQTHAMKHMSAHFHLIKFLLPALHLLQTYRTLAPLHLLAKWSHTQRISVVSHLFSPISQPPIQASQQVHASPEQPYQTHKVKHVKYDLFNVLHHLKVPTCRLLPIMIVDLHPFSDPQTGSHQQNRNS